ncbi:MAG: TRAP transporter substrate-binding protein [Candidatus Neomarinimicrobiota bacterium]|nr:TRAP transporter substrate-binding protein [Candidatus Neomarinimicrobiota bacterium]
MLKINIVYYQKIGRVLISVLVFLICCTTNESGYVVKYSNEQPESAIRSQSMIYFKEKLEKETNGNIKVELFFGGILGNERELMDLVSTGVLQGTRGGFFNDANPKFNLLTLPFLVRDWDQALRLVNSPFMKSINEGAKENGFHIPATGISQGFRAHTNNEKPIKHPSDFKGLKMRVPMQEVFIQTAKAFGANPQELAAIDIYQALQTGVIDGQDNPPSNIWDFKMHEVSKYLTVTNYATGPDPFIVNLSWYNTLTPELKTIFDRVAKEAMAKSDQMYRSKETEYLEQLSEYLEINYISSEALIPFQNAVKPVYDYFINKGMFTLEEIKIAQKIAKGNSQ